ncbi:MAG: YqeG family HAD IIIA-type phosphatase [Clostridia bacterium]|nr:YqeG family HAD IIIA-type phosphatase [Clostridia bacterium]
MILMPQFLLKDVFGLTEEFISENHVQGIIFDVDNTLVGFREPKPSPEVLDLLERLKTRGIKMAIASNNSRKRVSLFAEGLGIPAYHRSMKPLGFALRRICRDFGLPAKNCILVGDQIYTDMLGGNCAGMMTALVEPIDIKETALFRLKRALEVPVIEKRRRKEQEK